MENINKNFLLEEKFIEWRLHQTKEQDVYWEKFRNNNPELSKDIDIAIQKFEALRLDSHALSVSDKQNIYNYILRNTYRKNKIKKILKVSSSIAAILVIGLFITLFIKSNNDNKSELENTIVGQTLPEEDVYIVSGNSKTKLANNSNLELTTNNKKAIVVEDTENTKEVKLSLTEMNRLVVPYGKRSNIILADGSKVWLNSGTQLDFPSEFIGDTRSIKVNGEIYIEVKKDEKPFIVNTDKMSIRVHGTSFNVTAYEDEQINSVVLVEGKVGIKAPGYEKEEFIGQNEKIELSDNGMTKEFVDVSEYTSWTRDVLQFNKAPISEILKKVGRYYNVQFENSSEIELNEQTCSGKLYLSNNLDRVMSSISIISSTEYKRENNIIYIRKKE